MTVGGSLPVDVMKGQQDEQSLKLRRCVCPYTPKITFCYETATEGRKNQIYSNNHKYEA